MAAGRSPTVPYAEWGVGLLLALALAAFWPLYLSKLGQPIDPYTHAHAVAMTAWMLLLIVQPVLIRRGHRALHRSLGMLSGILVVVLVLAGLLLANQRFKAMSDDAFAGAYFTFYLPVSTLVQFLVAYGLGIWYRRRRALHGRFMLSTMIAGLDPIFARLAFFYIPGISETAPTYISYGLIDALLLWLIWRDRNATEGRVVFPAMGAMALVQQAGAFTLARTETFRAFADWYRHLPLT